VKTPAIDFVKKTKAIQECVFMGPYHAVNPVEIEPVLDPVNQRLHCGAWVTQHLRRYPRCDQTSDEAVDLVQAVQCLPLNYSGNSGVNGVLRPSRSVQFRAADRGAKHRHRRTFLPL
jgi:hypothetical protein